MRGQGPEGSGPAALLVVARVGRLVRRQWPEEAQGSGLHVEWHLPTGDVWRVFNTHVPPSAGREAGMSAARACLVEAMRMPALPILLQVIFFAHGWVAPRRDPRLRYGASATPHRMGAL